LCLDAVKLFMHIESVLVLAQALSLDIEDPLASHRKSSVVSVEVSGCVDYVGLVAQSSLDSAPTPQGAFLAALTLFMMHPTFGWNRQRT